MWLNSDFKSHYIVSTKVMDHAYAKMQTFW